jgi:GTPase
MKPQSSGEHRSGFVSLAGRPNVGKSTLVNRILGRELSIVTPKPQTTRNRITAIYTTDTAQIVLHDTPGIHKATTPLNRSLVAAATKTLAEADVVLLITAPAEEIHPDDLRIMALIKASGLPSVLAINKIDTVERPALLPLIDLYRKAHSFEEIVPISALYGDGVQDLIGALLKFLPLGPPLFPEDDVSDLPVRFFVQEIIREQIITKTGEEIPYKTAVVVESFKEEKGRISIRADIHVEKDSQKKILVGKGGNMIKAIGMTARAKIEDFLECHVRLDLFVKVSPNWSSDPAKLKEFGYY